MSILSWRGTPKTISFSRQNWHFWVLVILWAFSLERGTSCCNVKGAALCRRPLSIPCGYQKLSFVRLSAPLLVPWGEARRARGGPEPDFNWFGVNFGIHPIQKPSVLHSKTDIFKVSIRRKRILESQNYHFVEKWIWESQNCHVVEQRIWESQNFHFVERKRDAGKSACPLPRKNWKTYRLSRAKFGRLGLLNTVSYSQTHIFKNSSTGPMTDNQTVFEICSHAAPA